MELMISGFVNKQNFIWEIEDPRIMKRFDFAREWENLLCKKSALETVTICFPRRTRKVSKAIYINVLKINSNARCTVSAHIL